MDSVTFNYICVFENKYNETIRIYIIDAAHGILLHLVQDRRQVPRQ